MISSNQNTIVKKIKALNNKKNRENEGLFIAEGKKFVDEIPESWDIDLFAVSESFFNDNDISLYEEKAHVFVM